MEGEHLEGTTPGLDTLTGTWVSYLPSYQTAYSIRTQYVCILLFHAHHAHHHHRPRPRYPHFCKDTAASATTIFVWSRLTDARWPAVSHALKNALETSTHGGIIAWAVHRAVSVVIHDSTRALPGPWLTRRFCVKIVHTRRLQKGHRASVAHVRASRRIMEGRPLCLYVCTTKGVRRPRQ